ncbi:transposase [Caldichromatium japonicum]|uniref:Transposase n=1 Tax=Caldichromatium japonicum TaxID=2699430 RepID=A0A6G7VFF6_9GAMM|nr:transposase [Caldichromatium japonicum]QIK38606.1 transposase [Caldichromatium japonicum]
MTTKLHVAVDALGNPLRVILSAGQVADIEQAAALIQDQPTECVIADKGYDSDALVETVTAQGSQAVIPHAPTDSIRARSTGISTKTAI